MYTGWIYVIRNSINDKIYIGQTSKTLKIRFNEHKRDSKKSNYYNMLIYKAMNKYGTDNFIIRPIDYIKCLSLNCLKKSLDEKEIYYISVFKSKSKDIGYNLTNGGAGCTGRILRESSKKKMSESKLGEKNPMFGSKWSDKKREEMVERMSGENNHNYGKPLSNETKDKLSKVLTGRIISDESKQKISETMKGIKKSDKMRTKLSDSKQGTKLSEETKQKIKDSRLRGSINPKSKKVEQYDMDNNLITVFNSMSEAAKECNTFHSSISACCHGKKNTSNGFKWKFQGNC